MKPLFCLLLKQHGKLASSEQMARANLVGSSQAGGRGGRGAAPLRESCDGCFPTVPKLPDLHANSYVSNKQPDQRIWRLQAEDRATDPDSPGFGQQDGVLVRRRGFWKVAEDSEPVLQEFCSVVGEQNVQRLHVALLEEDPSIKT